VLVCGEGGRRAVHHCQCCGVLVIGEQFCENVGIWNDLKRGGGCDDQSVQVPFHVYWV
jgi:hypothetical protein